MPYTEKQRKFFNLCSHNPEKAQGKGPPKGAGAEAGPRSQPAVSQKHKNA